MANRKKTLVLVADDEPSTLAMVSAHLRARGYDVIEASDGDEAWELAHEHLPHLVVLDVMMPGMSGWEVCRKIREAVSLAHTGVVMLTGIGENLNEMTSPLYGADAYVDKPFEFTKLDEKLEETLAQRQGGALGRPDDADKEEPVMNGVGKQAAQAVAPVAAKTKAAASGLKKTTKRTADRVGAKSGNGKAVAKKAKKTRTQPVERAAATSGNGKAVAKKAATRAKKAAARVKETLVRAASKVTRSSASKAKTGKASKSVSTKSAASSKASSSKASSSNAASHRSKKTAPKAMTKRAANSKAASAVKPPASSAKRAQAKTARQMQGPGAARPAAKSGKAIRGSGKSARGRV